MSNDPRVTVRHEGTGETRVVALVTPNVVQWPMGGKYHVRHGRLYAKGRSTPWVLVTADKEGGE